MTERKGKKEAAISLLKSWQYGDPDEKEETLQIIEEALAEPECERCRYCYPDVVGIEVPGEGARRWCPECISDHMQKLDDQIQRHIRLASYYEEELRLREA